MKFATFIRYHAGYYFYSRDERLYVNKFSIIINTIYARQLWFYTRSVCHASSIKYMNLLQCKSQYLWRTTPAALRMITVSLRLVTTVRSGSEAPSGPIHNDTVVIHSDTVVTPCPCGVAGVKQYLPNYRWWPYGDPGDTTATLQWYHGSPIIVYGSATYRYLLI